MSRSVFVIVKYEFGSVLFILSEMLPELFLKLFVMSVFIRLLLVFTTVLLSVVKRRSKQIDEVAAFRREKKLRSIVLINQRIAHFIQPIRNSHVSEKMRGNKLI